MVLEVPIFLFQIRKKFGNLIFKSYSQNFRKFLFWVETKNQAKYSFQCPGKSTVQTKKFFGHKILQMMKKLGKKILLEISPKKFYKILKKHF